MSRPTTHMWRALSLPLAMAAVLICSVPASAATFSNPAPITIPTMGTASPYPSTVIVGGQPGTITDVNVTLSLVNHGDIADLGIALVAPDGRALELMGYAGQGAVGADYGIDDQAVALFPDHDAPNSATYKPTTFDRGSPDTFPAPCPAATVQFPAPFGGGTLAAFNGMDPNGIWSLCVRDFASMDPGTIDGGWRLDLTTAVTGQRDAALKKCKKKPHRKRKKCRKKARRLPV